MLTRYIIHCKAKTAVDENPKLWHEHWTSPGRIEGYIWELCRDYPQHEFWAELTTDTQEGSDGDNGTQS